MVGCERMHRRRATVEVAVAAYAEGHHPDRDPALARGAAQLPEAVVEAVLQFSMAGVERSADTLHQIFITLRRQIGHVGRPLAIGHEDVMAGEERDSVL